MNKTPIVMMFYSLIVLAAYGAGIASQSAYSVAAEQLNWGPAALGIGDVHSVIETETTGYARLWFKRAGQWIGHIGSSKDWAMTLGVWWSDEATLTLHPSGRAMLGASTAPSNTKFDVYTTPGAYGVTHRDWTITLGSYTSATPRAGWIGTATNHPLNLMTNANSRLIITTSGAVGIATSNPATGLKLDVEGKVWATDYCDSTGDNCFKPGDVSSDGSSSSGSFKTCGRWDNHSDGCEYDKGIPLACGVGRWLPNSVGRSDFWDSILWSDTQWWRTYYSSNWTYYVCQHVLIYTP